MVPIYVVFILLSFIDFNVQDTFPPPVLAFSIQALQDENGESQSGSAVTETVYLYDPLSQELRAVGTGDAVQWSMSGRYLAIKNVVNDFDYAGAYAGRIISFTIYDLQTGESYFQEYDLGVFFSWTPDESYLILSGSAYSGTHGSIQWIDIFSPNGSQRMIDTLSPPDRGMGFSVGISPSGWTHDGHLIARVRSARQVQTVLINPNTGEQTTIQGELPPHTPFPLLWQERTLGHSGISIAEDHSYASVSRVDREWYLREEFDNYLLIVELASGETHYVELPVTEHIYIASMAWRPCTGNVWLPHC